MRLVLKKLYEALKPYKLSKSERNELSKIMWNMNGDQEKISKWHKFWLEHMLKLKHPIFIDARTQWTSRSSSGTTKGFFKYDCKAIGLVNDIGNQLMLDKPSIVSNEFPTACDYMCDRISLSDLESSLLEKIASEI